jgi:hypothetical protein
MTTIDRTGCAAQRHGDMSAYQTFGCQCPDAREDQRLYYKRRREGRPYRRLQDATGTRRRIRALYAAGHTANTIAAAAGITSQVISRIARTNKHVKPATADAVNRAYQTLKDTPGASKINRDRATWWGWPTPQQWGEHIDDLDADPLAPASPDDVDEVLISRALNGQARAAELTPAERAEAVRVGLNRGLTVTTIALRMGTSNRAIHQLAAQHAA